MHPLPTFVFPSLHLPHTFSIRSPGTATRRYIAVLGVDFMSENVRAILNEAGHQDVGVYRMSAQSIGCSLAEAAESEQYNRCEGGIRGGTTRACMGDTGGTSAARSWDFKPSLNMMK